jgi:hypothetical protein
MPRAGKSIDWTGATGTPTWTTSTTASIFGSLTLITATTGMILTASTQAYTFEGRATGMPVGGWTITSAGNIWVKALNIRAFGGTYKLLDKLTGSNNANNVLSIAIGTFDANNQDVDVYAQKQVLGGFTYVINTGTGLWTLLGTGTVWNMGGTGTLNNQGSTIKITDTSNTAITFAGASETYNNIWFSRGASTASNTISGNNTFADFKDDGSEAHSLLITAGTTQHITTWNISGTSGKLITINSTSTAVFYLVKDGGGIVSADYLDIYHCVASPSNTWYAGENSVNHQSTSTAGSGWIFTPPFSVSSGAGFFDFFLNN